MPPLRLAAGSRILVDSSVWVDFTRGKPETKPIIDLLEENRVLTHIFVEAELRAGQLAIRRESFFELFAQLEYAPVIPFDELFTFIERRKAFAKGVSFVDISLLLSALAIGAQLWSHDKNLVALADEFDFDVYTT